MSENYLKRAGVDWQDRFWNNVRIVDSGCWVWIGAVFRSKDKLEGKAYGAFGRRSKESVPFREIAETAAHRISWVIANGPIPLGEQVLHHCDNPPCVNPDHLFLGTSLDNVRDKHKKGRQKYASGCAHGMAKQGAKDIREIREKYNTGKWTLQELADMFDSNISSISMIARKISYKDVE